MTRKPSRRVAKPRTTPRRKRPTQNSLVTFQGRPVKTILWKGVKCAAVEGVVITRRRQARPARALEFERLASIDDRSLRALGLTVVSETQALAERVMSLGAGLLPSEEPWFEPVLIDRISRIPSDPLVNEQWGFEMVNAGVVFDGNVDLSGVLLAILDSGIPIEASSLSHQDLSHERFNLGRDVVNGDADPADDHGHGTHVLGLAAAIADNQGGVAGVWQGPVLVIKTFDSQGAGSSVTFADALVAAVDFAQAKGLRLVVNYSGGGADSDTKRVAVEHARKNGALIIAAAGNSFGSAIEFPAAYSASHDNVIAVGAVKRDRTLADFCNVGPEMNVCAPGEDIISTLPNYFVTLNSEGKQTKFDRLSGTSQAAPLVAALAAHIWARRPNLTAALVRQRILDTADPVEGGQLGSGIINFQRAL